MSQQTVRERILQEENTFCSTDSTVREHIPHRNSSNIGSLLPPPPPLLLLPFLFFAPLPLPFSFPLHFPLHYPFWLLKVAFPLPLALEQAFAIAGVLAASSELGLSRLMICVLLRLLPSGGFVGSTLVGAQICAASLPRACMRFQGALLRELLGPAPRLHLPPPALLAVEILLLPLRFCADPVLRHLRLLVLETLRARCRVARLAPELLSLKLPLLVCKLCKTMRVFLRCLAPVSLLHLLLRPCVGGSLLLAHLRLQLIVGFRPRGRRAAACRSNGQPVRRRRGCRAIQPFPGRVVPLYPWVSLLARGRWGWRRAARGWPGARSRLLRSMQRAGRRGRVGDAGQPVEELLEEAGPRAPRPSECLWRAAPGGRICDKTLAHLFELIELRWRLMVLTEDAPYSPAVHVGYLVPCGRACVL